MNVSQLKEGWQQIEHFERWKTSRMTREERESRRKVQRGRRGFGGRGRRSAFRRLRDRRGCRNEVDSKENQERRRVRVRSRLGSQNAISVDNKKPVSTKLRSDTKANIQERLLFSPIEAKKREKRKRRKRKYREKMRAGRETKRAMKLGEGDPLFGLVVIRQSMDVYLQCTLVVTQSTQEDRSGFVQI